MWHLLLTLTGCVLTSGQFLPRSIQESGAYLNLQKERKADPRTLHVHHHHHHHLSHHPVHHHHVPHHHKHRPVHVSHTFTSEVSARSHQDPGSHLFLTPLIWARETVPHTHRSKRALPQVAAARLAADPNVRVNLIGTLDNLKDATKDVLESGDSPLYHIREALGSARDVVFSIMKLSPTGLLIPTTYRVSQVEPGDTVAAINPAMLKNGLTDNKQEAPADGTDDTMQTVHLMLKESFRGARDSFQHAGDTVHSVRRAALTAPTSMLRLLLPYLRALQLQPAPKPGAGPLLRSTAAAPDQPVRFLGAGKLLELLRAVASSDTSKERVSSALPCPNQIPGTKSYKTLVDKIKKDLANKINNKIK